MRPDDPRLADLAKGLARIAQLRRECAEEEARFSALLMEVLAPGAPLPEAPAPPVPPSPNAPTIAAAPEAPRPIEPSPPPTQDRKFRHAKAFVASLDGLKAPFTPGDVREHTRLSVRGVLWNLRRAVRRGLLRHPHRGVYEFTPKGGTRRG